MAGQRQFLHGTSPFQLHVTLLIKCCAAVILDRGHDCQSPYTWGRYPGADDFAQTNRSGFRPNIESTCQNPDIPGLAKCQCLNTTDKRTVNLLGGGGALQQTRAVVRLAERLLQHSP